VSLLQFSQPSPSEGDIHLGEIQAQQSLHALEMLLAAGKHFENDRLFVPTKGIRALPGEAAPQTDEACWRSCGAASRR
jgi:hypothetical protein